MNCRMSTRFLSEALDRELTKEERDEVERHLTVCPACTECRRQFDDIRAALRRFTGVGFAG